MGHSHRSCSSSAAPPHSHAKADAAASLAGAATGGLEWFGPPCVRRTATASSIGRDGLPVPFHAASYVDVVSMDLPRSLRHDRDGQHRWQVIIERREGVAGSRLR